MNKAIMILSALLFICGCGGVIYIEVKPLSVLVEPGKYNVVFEAQVGRGDCDAFPVYEEKVLDIHESQDGSLWLSVGDITLTSTDRSIFRGRDNNISVTAIAGGTASGIEGTVILSVDYGILFSCTDFADFVGTKVGDT